MKYRAPVGDHQRARLMGRAFWGVYFVLSLLVGAGTITTLSITAAEENSTRVAAARTEVRNEFYTSLLHGGMEGKGEVATLSRAVSELAQSGGKGDDNPLTVSSLSEVYVAPAMFNNVSDQIGEKVFDGIRSDGGSYVCDECGALSESFQNHILVATSGDLSGLVKSIPPIKDYPQGLILLTGAGAEILLVPTVAWAMATRAGRKANQNTAFHAYQLLSRGKMGRIWAVAALPLGLWRIAVEIHEKKEERKQERARRHLEEQKALQEAERIQSNPFSYELIKARKNLESLKQMEKTERVTAAIKATQELISKLENEPHLNRIVTQENLAQSMLEDAQKELNKVDSIIKARAEISGQDMLERA